MSMSLIKRLWPAKGKAKPIEIHGHGEVYSITFSPDGKHVGGGGQSKTIRQWQVVDGREVGEKMEVGSYLLNIAVSKDGQLIACGGPYGLAEVWDLETRKKVVQLEASAARVFAVDVSPDSTRFATGADQNVSVWSIPSGQLLLGPLKHSESIAAVKFSPRGDRIATATWERNSIRLYDSSDGHLLLDIPDRVSSPYNTSLAWSNDGKQLFVASYAGKIKCFHVSGSLFSWTEWSIQTNNQPASIALASNGKFIAAAWSRFVSFWDTSTHTQIGPVIEHAERVWSIALSKDGHLASGGDDKMIILRNLRNILPQSYFLDLTLTTVDHASNSQRSPQSPTMQQSSSLLAEVHRLEALLSERDTIIEESRKEKGTHEQTIQQLEQEISSLRATVQGLRAQLLDSQGAVQRLELEYRQLTSRLETSQSPGQHKLEPELIESISAEPGVKDAAEPAQAQKVGLLSP